MIRKIGGFQGIWRRFPRYRSKQSAQNRSSDAPAWRVSDLLDAAPSGMMFFVFQSTSKRHIHLIRKTSMPDTTNQQEASPPTSQVGWSGISALVGSSYQLLMSLGNHYKASSDQDHHATNPFPNMGIIRMHHNANQYLQHHTVTPIILCCIIHVSPP